MSYPVGMLWAKYPRCPITFSPLTLGERQFMMSTQSRKHGIDLAMYDDTPGLELIQAERGLEEFLTSARNRLKLMERSENLQDRDRSALDFRPV